MNVSDGNSKIFNELKRIEKIESHGGPFWNWLCSPRESLIMI